MINKRRLKKKNSRKKLNKFLKSKERKENKVYFLLICLLFALLFAIFIRLGLPALKVKFGNKKPSSSEMINSYQKNLDKVDGFSENSHDKLQAKGEKNSDEVISSPKKKRKTGELLSRIKTQLRKDGVDFLDLGFMYFNFKTQEVVELNSDLPYLAASTSKLPINVLAADMANKGEIDYNTTLTLTEDNLEGGTGILQYENVGSVYSIGELLDMMIIYSDNVATNMLYGYFGSVNGEYLLDTLNRVYGMQSLEGNYMSPMDAIYFLKKIYYNSEKNPYYDKIIYNLKHTIYNDYFTKDIKREAAHKVGDFDASYNDIGLVYGNEDYAFAIYNQNIDSEETIVKIGKIVDDWHNGK